MNAKKLLSLVLTLVLLLTLLPTYVAPARAVDEIEQVADGINWNKTKSRYEISSAAGLKTFREIVNGENGQTKNSAACAVLMEDIDLENAAWTPIGNVDNKYTGTFDGGGFEIENLHVSTNGQTFAGLFGYIARGTVKNLTVRGTVIAENNDRVHAGGIAGYIYGGRLENCVFGGTVRAEATNINYSCAGGIAGYISNSEVTGCSSSGTVSASAAGGYSAYAGGLAGEILNGNVSASFSDASADAKTESGTAYAGGFAGYISGGKVSASFSDASADAIAESGTAYAGGFAGYIDLRNDVPVENCFSTGAVTAKAGISGYAGGFAGSINNNGSLAVRNCYSTGAGTVEGGTYYGFVGGGNGTVSGCYWLKSAAGKDPNAAPLDADQFAEKNNFKNGSALWDFTNVWEMDKTLGRPVLKKSADTVAPVEPPLVNGVYEISSYAELKGFAKLVNDGEKSANGRLMKKITAEDAAFTPIGNVYNNKYTGTFDGGGFEIQNLQVSTNGQTYAGLFGYINGGTVKNLTVRGTVIAENNNTVYAGGIAGYVEDGRLENCVFSGTVRADATGVNNSYAGGIAGYIANSEVTGCSSSGTVSASAAGTYTANAGGFAGEISDGKASACFSDASADAKDESGKAYAGGFAGSIVLNNDDDFAENCYSTGAVTAKAASVHAGGFAGSINIFMSAAVRNCYSTGAFNGENADDYRGFVANGRGNISGCYYMESTQYNDNCAAPLDADQFAEKNNFVNGSELWDFENVWDMDETLGRPILKKSADTVAPVEPPLVNGVYEISSYAELKGFARLVNDGNGSANGRLMKDITAEDAAFTPIGNGARSYGGTFDGGGFEIQNLQVSTNGERYAGLFGYISGGTVKDLTVRGTVIAENNDMVHAGGIAGCVSSEGRLENCVFSGTVRADATGVNYSYAGGIAGEIYESEVTGCSSSGTVSASAAGIYTARAGGFAGQITNGKVSASFSDASADVKTESGKFNVGGFAGFINLYNDGSLVENCFSTGAVTAKAASVYAGGFAGAINVNMSAAVRNCYSTGAGTVEGGTYYGFVGDGSGNISGCYWLKGAAGSDYYAAMLTKDQFADKNNFKNGYELWAFGTIWDIDETLGRPVLTAFVEPVEPVCEIDGTGYPTLEAALDAVTQDNTVITILQDIEFDGKRAVNGYSITLQSGKKDVVVTLTGAMKFGENTSPASGKTYTLQGNPKEKTTLTIEPKLTNGENAFRPIAIRQGNVLYLSTGAVLQGSVFSGGKGGMVNVASDAEFWMDGGTIRNCAAEQGGAVYIAYEGTFVLRDGLIENCTARHKTEASAAGSSVNAAGGAVYTAGTFIQESGEIRNCTAESGKGGGVYVFPRQGGGGSFLMSGGTISGCKATENENADLYYNDGEGGGVYIGSADGSNVYKLTVTGGTITGNTAKTGGGVYLHEGATARICGKVYIHDNTGSNVYLTDGTALYIADALDSGAKLGVSMASPGVFTAGWKTEMDGKEPEDYFTSDDTAYAVVLDASAGEAMLSHTFAVTASANPTDGGTVSGAGDYAPGKTATLTASPSEGWVFVNWTKDGVQVSTSPAYSFTVEAAGAYVANFEEMNGHLTVTAKVTSQPQNGTAYTMGETVVFKITVTNDGNVAITDITVQADLTGDSFTIGRLAPEQTTQAFTISYTVTEADAQTGKLICKVSAAGTSPDLDVPDVPVTPGEAEVPLEFPRYAITASANPTNGGTVSGAGDYTYGTTATLTADPNTGWLFVNWTKDGVEVSTDPEYSFTVEAAGAYVANFKLQEFEITFVDEDGETELDKQILTYGSTPEYKGETPTKKSTAEHSYTFDGWTPELAPVTEAATYTAKYKEIRNEYTITFINEDGTVLQTGKVAYGETPVYKGATPTKASTATTAYAFAGWTPALVPATKDATYTATFAGAYVPLNPPPITPTNPTTPTTPTTPPVTPDNPPPYVNPFNDVGLIDYFYDAVRWAVQHGITTGTTSTTFSPGIPCNRAQMVTFLWRAAGSPEPTSSQNPFIDLDPNEYYYKAVLWAYETGLTTGTGDGKFDPNGPVDRAQMVTFLWRLAGSPEPKTEESPFDDIDPNAYYYKAVLWAYENGITTGVGGGKFAPTAPCTRGQIVTFLYRYFGEE